MARDKQGSRTQVDGDEGRESSVCDAISYVQLVSRHTSTHYAVGLHDAESSILYSSTNVRYGHLFQPLKMSRSNYKMPIVYA